MARPYAQFLILACLLSAFGGCKFVKTAELAARAEAAAKPTAAASGTAMWSSQVVPYFAQNAHPLADVRAALGGGLDAAGKSFGYREVPEGAPWNFPVRLAGIVTQANTKSRAATIDLDTDGDGKADVTVQLGPVIKGTSIRDVLPFVSFTGYANQIEFADVAKAFNTQAYETVLKDVPRDDLIGKRVEAVGVFTLRSASDKILVTPVELKLETGA